MAEKITLTKQDRKKVWWRHQFLQGSWNYERMQNGGWCYSIIPAIKKLYSNKEDQIAALKRHMEFYNTHPYVSSPVMGVTLALEEEKANGENVDDTAIQGVKVGMMGPLAGAGPPRHPRRRRCLLLCRSASQFLPRLGLWTYHLAEFPCDWRRTGRTRIQEGQDQSSSWFFGMGGRLLSYTLRPDHRLAQEIR
jgi:hypothetical protein